jgi:methyl-accepting chemotaxis protein
MFGRMSLKAKLLLLSGTLAVGLLVVGALGSRTLSMVTRSSDHVASVNFVNFRLVASMRYYATDFARNYLRALIPDTDAKDLEKVSAALAAGIQAFEKVDKSYNEIPFSEGEGALYNAQLSAWKAFSAAGLRFASLIGSADPKERVAATELVTKELPKLRAAHAESLQKLLDYHAADSDKWVQQAKDDARTGSVFSWTLTIACFVFAAVFGILLSNALARTLRDIAARLSGGAEEVASASQQVSASSEELSSSVAEQAASLQETSASIEEMNSMISKNAENAAQSREISQTSQTAAENGQKAVADMLRSMEEINASNTDIMQQIEQSNRNIEDIVKVIAEIGNKTKVINDIVFQTKLLSFNASVEAARAGEHGKGFAVVAEEVGNLAQMSGAAAKEISTMLEGSIKKVEDIVIDTKSKVERLIQVGREKVESGVQVARLCSTALERMAGGIVEVGSRVSEIATASQEQSTGVKQITQAVGQLDQATQQNSAASQQTASAAVELSAQAESLRAMVLELLRTIDGGATRGAGRGDAVGAKRGRDSARDTAPSREDSRFAA